MSNRLENTTLLPLPPETLSFDRDDAAVNMEIYARFMQHLRHVPNSRMEIKILSAIQFTADMMDYTDAQVAKVLVDLGLRSSRAAMPADFLSFADQALMRSRWDVGGPNEALLALKDHWDRTGEDKFAAFRREFSLVDERIAV